MPYTLSYLDLIHDTCLTYSKRKEFTLKDICFIEKKGPSQALRDWFGHSIIIMTHYQIFSDTISEFSLEILATNKINKSKKKDLATGYNQKYSHFHGNAILSLINR